MRWLLPLLIVAGCFPALPDEDLVDNLRVLAVNVDPAMARFDVFPPPEVTVTALTVHPDDEDLDGANHRWFWDLGEDVDSEVFDAMLPEEPHGSSITLDLAQLLQARGGEIELVPGTLPLSYVVDFDGDHRNTVKLLQFLLPSFGEPGERDELGPLPGPDEDDDGPALPEVELNENPQIVAIQVASRAEFSAEAGTLTGLDGVLFVGAIDEAGETITVTIADDKDVDEVRVRLMRTSGCPSLEQEPPDGPGGRGFSLPADADDPCGDSQTFGGGGAFGEEDETPETREFDWRPYPGEDSPGTRLFIVLRDGDGAQTWQELRPEDAP